MQKITHPAGCHDKDINNICKTHAKHAVHRRNSTEVSPLVPPICPVCDWEMEMGGGEGHWFPSIDMSAVLSSPLLGVGVGVREKKC